MALSRKHFEAVAGVISNAHMKAKNATATEEEERAYHIALYRVATDLGEYFVTENSAFDRERFADASIASLTHKE